MRTKDTVRLARAALVTMLILGVGTPAIGHDDDACSRATLSGLYVFSAAGFVTLPGGIPFPKAITQLIRFDGDGGVTTPAATVAVTGRPLFFLEPGATGTYIVSDLVPPDHACVGTVEFNDQTHNTFNMIIPPGAKTISLIQTNVAGNPASVTNVFQGTATRIAH
jgi:hypothetical protein